VVGARDIAEVSLSLVKNGMHCCDLTCYIELLHEHQRKVHSRLRIVKSLLRRPIRDFVDKKHAHWSEELVGSKNLNQMAEEAETNSELFP
jgi:hypothetical protein